MCTCYDDERNYSQIKTYPKSQKKKPARIKRSFTICIFDNDKFKARIVIPSAVSVLLKYNIGKVTTKKTLRKKANAIWLNAHRAHCESNCRWIWGEIVVYDCSLKLFVSLLHLISDTSYAYRHVFLSLSIRLHFAKQKQFVNKFLTDIALNCYWNRL